MPYLEFSPDNTDLNEKQQEKLHNDEEREALLEVSQNGHKNSRSQLGS